MTTDQEPTATADAAPKKPKKLTKGEEQALLVASLEARIEKLEAKQKVIVDGYQFVANETRPLYGFGAIALVFDAIYDKLSK